jgi:hypothetical protein
MPSRRRAAISLVATAMLASACTSASSQQPAEQAGPSSALTPQVTSSCRPGINAAEFWIMNADELSALQAADAGDASYGLRSANLFVLEPPQTHSPAGQTVAYFKSYAAFRSAITQHGIATGTHWVAYDNEAWPATPEREQRDPLRYETLFASLAHSHGYKVMLMPAQNLIPGFSRGSDAWQQYLDLGLASTSGRVADIYEIQAQPYELAAFRQAGDFQKFVQQAAAQAHAANPNVVVFAGLSTARVSTVSDLTQDFADTRGLVAGYWLNIPSANKSSGDPAMAGAFLRTIPSAADSAAKTCARG